MQDDKGTPQARPIRWTLIAATDRSRLRGIVEAVGLRLPWYLSDDMCGNRRATPSCPVVMGRRAFESIGGALPGRLNVVLTRQQDFASGGGVVVAHDAAAVRRALHRDGAAGMPEAFLVGGAAVFGQLLPDARRLCLTEVGRTFDGNAIFARPARRASERAAWRQVERERRFSDQGFEYDFVVYERRQADEARGSRAPGHAWRAPEARPG